MCYLSDMHDAIAKHCEELNRCNQRGGRMLSVFDLITAKTLDLDLAAYLMARISKGSSFMVGSVPGGAGKTTVMCALLNFLPIDLPIVAATDQAVYKHGSFTAPSAGSCARPYTAVVLHFPTTWIPGTSGGHSSGSSMCTAGRGSTASAVESGSKNPWWPSAARTGAPAARYDSPSGYGVITSGF